MADARSGAAPAPAALSSDEAFQVLRVLEGAEQDILRVVALSSDVATALASMKADAVDAAAPKAAEAVALVESTRRTLLAEMERQTTRP